MRGVIVLECCGIGVDACVVYIQGFEGQGFEHLEAYDPGDGET